MVRLQPILEHLRGHRSPHQKTLALIAAGITQKIVLCLGLDTFGSDAKTEGMAQVDDRPGDGHCVVIGGQVLDERTINFQVVDG
ncbi:hypothetical protein D3C76_1786660 [compost metagenome]